jgi:LuxR family maltose regulon positive regulatory protein
MDVAGWPTTSADSVPAVSGGIVSRRPLWGRLGQATRVTEVSAPAGSGKTFLLRSWIRETGLARSAAWVSVQRGERDPQRFWVAVADALSGTDTGSVVRPLTGAPDLDGWAIVERLLADLVRLDERVWLVVDDVHELASAEALLQLELLVLRAPPELRFVLATRRDLRLGLHRLRLEGELTEIRARDLRFTLDEARALFEAAGVHLPDTALVLLVDRAEGWAAGLRLAALSLTGHPDPERFAEEFSGSERTVADYLLAEVLERQSEEVRRLLLRTSVLDRVSGELADLLSGGTSGERILQELETVNAFVVSLDTQRTWFRYHHMFADLLQLELRSTVPAEIPALHATAAGWFAGRGFAVEAVRHAQAAQDWTLAARLLADHWVNLELNGQGATARELLARFPAGAAAASAELAALTAAGELTRGSLEEAERQLALARRQSGSVPADRHGRLQVMLTVLRLQLARQRGDLPAVAEEADRLFAAVDAPDAVLPGLGEDLRALAMISLGIAELWTARSAVAKRHLEQGVALARRIGRPFLELTALAHGSTVTVARSYRLGAQQSRQAIELAERHGWGEEPVAGIAYLQLGGALTAQGRLDEAERWLDRAGRTLRAEVEPAAGMTLQTARGMFERARGRPERALDAFGAHAALAKLLRTPHVDSPWMRAQALHALVRLDQADRVEAALAQMDDQQRDAAFVRSVIAALRLAANDPRAATAALAPVVAGSVPAGHPIWLVEALLLEAIARDALSDQAAAGHALERALDLAEPDGMLFPFLVHPAPGLLEGHGRGATAHSALIGEILGVLAGTSPPVSGDHEGTGSPAGGNLGGIAPPGAPRIVSSGVMEPLSRAETRVLRYLPTSLTVAEIADQLYLSVNTVRTHMRHIYDKLAAHRRHEAVEQARTLGLLAPSARRS